MSQHSQQGEDPEPGPVAAGRAAAGRGANDLNGGRPLHLRSFKLRFASQREPGRSDVSLVKPLGLPATVAEGPQRAGRGAGAGAAEAAALRRVRDMFAQGPREKYAHPVTASHVYGWFWDDEALRMAAAPFSDRRLNHHIQDSSWLKSRLLVLAADDKLKQR